MIWSKLIFWSLFWLSTFTLNWHTNGVLNLFSLNIWLLRTRINVDVYIFWSTTHQNDVCQLSSLIGLLQIILLIFIFLVQKTKLCKLYSFFLLHHRPSIITSDHLTTKYNTQHNMACSIDTFGPLWLIFFYLSLFYGCCRSNVPLQCDSNKIGQPCFSCALIFVHSWRSLILQRYSQFDTFVLIRVVQNTWNT